MATPQLRLKRQVGVARQTPAKTRPIVEVWVDSNVPHLDHSFSYLVPESISESVDVGTLVKVPFHGRSLQALVISRNDSSKQELKFIEGVISPFPLLTNSQITLITEVAKNWASHPFDILRSAIPERAPTVEKQFAQAHAEVERRKTSFGKSTYLQFPPFQSIDDLIIQRIEKQGRGARVLLLLPDVRSVERLSRSLEGHGRKYISLSSTQSRSVLYSNYLSIVTGEVNLVLGTRNAIFAPLRNIDSIIVVHEQSEHYYDRRQPHWNVRDVARRRAAIERVNLEFLGYSPSADLAMLIDSGEVSFHAAKSKLSIQVAEQHYGELIPSIAMKTIRSALTQGPILFLTPAKGYSQSIRCAACKTPAKCSCGGALIKKSRVTPISCLHCAQSFNNWRCMWCDHPVPYFSARGSERFQQELGALFPKTQIHLRTSENTSDEDVKNGIVIATPSMAPVVTEGYSAVVILEGNRFLSQPDFRSGERTRSIFFETIALAKKSAPIILVQDKGHPIVNALSTWSPAAIIHRELEELKTLSLPPTKNAHTLTLPTSEISRVKTALSSNIGKQLPANLLIHGPAKIDEENSRIILISNVEDESKVTELLHEFLRKRSATKKSLPTIEVNPYSLTIRSID